MIRARWGLVAACLVVPTFSPADGAALLGHYPASRAGVASGSWTQREGTVAISCASSTGFADFVIAVGLESDKGFAPLITFSSWPRGSDRGDLVMVANVEMTTEKRVERSKAKTLKVTASVTFQAAGAWTMEAVHVALATWTGKPPCTVRLGTKALSVTYPADASAMFVDPTGFTGGVFMQDGRSNTTLARTWAAVLPPGLIVGGLFPGGELDVEDPAADPMIAGFVATDGLSPYSLVSPCLGPCAFGGQAASLVDATIPFRIDDEGSKQGLLYISIPD